MYVCLKIGRRKPAGGTPSISFMPPVVAYLRCIPDMALRNGSRLRHSMGQAHIFPEGQYHHSADFWSSSSLEVFARYLSHGITKFVLMLHHYLSTMAIN